MVPFPAAISIAYYAKLTNYPLVLNWWMLVSLMFFLAAFACFSCAIKGFRMPPWKKIEFPDIQVDLYGLGFMSIPRTIAVAGIVPEASGVITTTESLRFLWYVLPIWRGNKTRAFAPKACRGLINCGRH